MPSSKLLSSHRGREAPSSRHSSQLSSAFHQPVIWYHVIKCHQNGCQQNVGLGISKLLFPREAMKKLSRNYLKQLCLSSRKQSTPDYSNQWIPNKKQNHFENHKKVLWHFFSSYPIPFLAWQQSWSWSGNNPDNYFPWTRRSRVDLICKPLCTSTVSCLLDTWNIYARCSYLVCPTWNLGRKYSECSLKVAS